MRTTDDVLREIRDYLQGLSAGIGDWDAPPDMEVDFPVWRLHNWQGRINDVVLLLDDLERSIPRLPVVHKRSVIYGADQDRLQALFDDGHRKHLLRVQAALEALKEPPQRMKLATERDPNAG